MTSSKLMSTSKNSNIQQWSTSTNKQTRNHLYHFRSHRVTSKMYLQLVKSQLQIWRTKGIQIGARAGISPPSDQFLKVAPRLLSDPDVSKIQKCQIKCPLTSVLRNLSNFREIKNPTPKSRKVHRQERSCLIGARVPLKVILTRKRGLPMSNQYSSQKS